MQVVDYYPFGSIRTKKNYGDYENKYLFGGKEQDSETDLQYFEARYYDNGIGRFNSIDKMFWEVGGFDQKNKYERGDKVLIFPQELNSYSYVVNNPLNYTDSNGENTLYGDIGTGTPADFLIKAYVTGIIAVGTYIGVQISDHVVDKIIESTSSSSATGSPSPGNNNGKKPKKNENNKKSKNWNKGDKVNTPETNSSLFMKSKINNGPNKSNCFIDNVTKDMWFRSNTSHKGDVWKVFEKGTKQFIKESGKRKSVKKDGTVVGN